jgi:hypothetical protein
MAWPFYKSGMGRKRSSQLQYLFSAVYTASASSPAYGTEIFISPKKFNPILNFHSCSYVGIIVNDNIGLLFEIWGAYVRAVIIHGAANGRKSAAHLRKAAG